MKVFPFKIPKPENELVRHQVDQVSHFYDKLHQHPELQLTVILKGEGSLVVGDYIGRFRPGEIYLMGSNVPHVFRNDERYYREHSSRQAHSESLFFDLELFERRLAGIAEFEGLPERLRSLDGCYRITGRHHFIRSRIVKLRNLTGLQKIIRSFEVLELIVEGDLPERLNSLGSIRNYSAHEGKRMENVMRFLMEQSQRPITLAEVAGVASMNKEAFCRFFKERTRKTITEFLNEVRIARACQLLGNKDLTMMQVAAESGIPNLSYFNRVFRKIKGMTPREFRASYLSETEPPGD
ncbi:MAG: AraC family transcriptional regulator [Bacteroides sp.]|jgi:AraC-like DNA-binding protein|nr:AraC family transcriptional regulator [Bacteroides sp.]